MTKKNVAIVGAGLVGSLWAIFLAKRGYNVSLFDRRSDIRKVKIVQGKSINLALSERGWKGLEQAGVRSEIEAIAIPMSGRLMHDTKGELTYQNYGADGQAIYSVSRGILNQTLVQCASKFENVQINFEHKCTDVNLEKNTLSFQTATNEIVSQSFDQIYGTDGAFSAVRQRLTKIDRNDFSQSYLDHGYKELEIPANSDGTHKMRSDCLHIWPRGEFMMIALPNIDGSFTCTLFFPFEGNPSFSSLKTDDEILNFFSTYFSDAKELMPELLDDFRNNPTSSLVMMKCNPWNYENRIALLGDAAHAIVPFYGQGMNCGFEDCTEFNRLMDEMGDEHPALFQTYSNLRKPNGDAILELALRNYIEMRDLTADEHFLLQKKIESRFSAKYPDKWIPLYTQVSFTHTPYSEALASGIQQHAIMQEVMNRPDIQNIWDSEEIENEILKRL
jgi:kynurenine 3-monooxygenase